MLIAHFRSLQVYFGKALGGLLRILELILVDTLSFTNVSTKVIWGNEKKNRNCRLSTNVTAFSISEAKLHAFELTRSLTEFLSIRMTQANHLRHRMQATRVLQNHHSSKTNSIQVCRFSELHVVVNVQRQ